VATRPLRVTDVTAGWRTHIRHASVGNVVSATPEPVQRGHKRVVRDVLRLVVADDARNHAENAVAMKLGELLEVPQPARTSEESDEITRGV